MNGKNRRAGASPPEASNDYLAEHAGLLIASYHHWTGRNLVDTGQSALGRARTLYEAPFFVASHGTEPDPVFNYGIRAALALFETTWEEFTSLPSRLSAELVARAERERLRARVHAHGFIDDYSGVRIAIRGRRVRDRARHAMERDRRRRRAARGQAVMFRDGEYL